jgi:hypothetical protein
MRQEFNCLLSHRPKLMKKGLMKKGPMKKGPGLTGPFFRHSAGSAVYILLVAALLAGPTALFVLILLILLALLALLLSGLLPGLLLLLMALGLRILLARLIVLVGHNFLRGWVFPTHCENRFRCLPVPVKPCSSMSFLVTFPMLAQRSGALGFAAAISPRSIDPGETRF